MTDETRAKLERYLRSTTSQETLGTFFIDLPLDMLQAFREETDRWIATRSHERKQAQLFNRIYAKY